MPHHPAVKEWSPPDKYVIIIEIEPAEELPRAVPLTDELFNSLIFITNRKKGGGGWSDHF